MTGPFDEHVLVVRREDLFAGGEWQGFRAEGVDGMEEVIRLRSFFMPRRDVEDDPSYQQVIPYLVFRHGDRYLLTKRLKASSEKRLRQLYSLGVGGHINPGDVDRGDPVQDGLRREWEEEVEYASGYTTRLIGAINDDSSPVSRVHVAFVFLVEGESPEISIREVDKLSGELLTLDEMRRHYLEMESWSQIVYDRLAEPGG